MALKALLPILSETVFGAVSVYSVVQGGANEPFLIRAEGHSRHAVHAGVCHVLDLNWHAQVPHPDGLVITGCNKPPALIHKGDGVDSCQVVVILLDDISRFQIPLVDFLVGAASQHHVLLLGMELGNIVHLALPKGLDDLPRLGVPQLDDLVIAGAEKALAIVAEVYILHTLHHPASANFHMCCRQRRAHTAYPKCMPNSSDAVACSRELTHITQGTSMMVKETRLLYAVEHPANFARDRTIQQA